MEFIGVIIFILVATAVVLGVIAVAVFFILGLFLKRTPKNTQPALSVEEQHRKLVDGYRDPIRFFGDAGLRT